MRRPQLALAVLLALSLVVVGCKADPSSPEYWEKRINDGKGTKGKLKAVEDLRESKHLTPAVYPVLRKHVEAAKSHEVRAAIARVLGEVKDKDSVDALSNAVDFGASEAAEKAMNKEIAIALGNIGDPKAVPTLVKLLSNKDNFTAIAAIEALGEMKAKEGFEALYKIANDDNIEPFITKKAVIALGNIGDPRAVPRVTELMFKERRGISFYMESSFALYQFGTPAADALIPVLEGKDKDLLGWAEKNNVKDIALVAKAAQVLGDLHDKRAEKTLIGMLGYKTEFDDIRMIMRMRGADALARMRSKAAVKPIADLLAEDEANARQQYVWALTRIGGTEAVPKLIDCAAKGSWDGRGECMKGVALLGTDGNLGAFDKFAKEEQKLTEGECKEYPEYFDCKPSVEAGVKKHLDTIAKYRAVLDVAKSCKDAACWATKLDDANAAVRERAAYEVGRSNNAALVGELTKRLREKDLDSRLAIIQACDWLTEESPEALKAAQSIVPDLTKQLAEERGKTEFVKVNEDLRRLHVRLTRPSQG